jgi:acetolactate decarboxylase
MPQLNTTISSDLWRSLADRADKTREPLADIVHKALAGYLQIPHHNLYQVSTKSALVEGIYQGAIRVGTMRGHGDFGLGTFENVDGEMVIINGHCFQLRSDGSVQECHDDVLSPFVVITRFEPEETVTLDPNLRLLLQRGGEYHIALPETEAFLKADLHRDPSADLAKADKVAVS